MNTCNDASKYNSLACRARRPKTGDRSGLNMSVTINEDAFHDTFENYYITFLSQAPFLPEPLSFCKSSFGDVY